MRPSLSLLLASGFDELDDLNGVICPRLRKPYSLSDLAAALAVIEPSNAKPTVAWCRTGK